MNDLEDVPIRDVGWMRAHLEKGSLVRRRSWLGALWLELRPDKAGHIMLGGRRYMIWYCGHDGDIGMWNPRQSDIMATDWEVAGAPSSR
jgi:Protein of unknown function (DUF2829)